MTQERLPERSAPDPDAGPDERFHDRLQNRPTDNAPQPGHAPDAVQSLKQAMRRARFDDAERLGAMSDLRAARIGRLELLAEALQPLVAQIPEDVDLFDFGLMPGANPRLFLDMIGFVEMGRDARTYRLVQDTRHGRRLIAESDNIGKIVEAATDYVARRLLERDKALAADAEEAEDRRFAPAAARAPARRATRLPDAETTGSRRSRMGRFGGALFAILIDLLGAIAFFAIVFYAAWVAWTHLHGEG